MFIHHDCFKQETAKNNTFYKKEGINMAKENQKPKNSVFVDLFQTSEFAEKNVKELSRWLLNLEDDWDGKIEPFRLENALYMDYQNDVSYIVDDRLLVFSEHQSTINNNMPARMLIYVGRVLERHLPAKVRFKKQLVKIPRPLFYVFYNGTDKLPPVSHLNLRDAYKDVDSLLHNVPEEYKGGELDLTVTVININQYIDDNENELIKNCPVIWEYAQFSQKVRECNKNEFKKSLEDVVNECINDDILREYLISRSSEVINMVFGEYNYDEDIAVQREEAKEETYIKYATKMLAKNKSSEEIIAELKDIFDLDETLAKNAFEAALTKTH